MKLSLINEATLEDVQRRISVWQGKYFKTTPQEKAIQTIKQAADADPTKGKYTEWIIRQLTSNKIRLPEDSHRVKETISNFDRLKNRLPEKDISKYNHVSEIEDAIDNLQNVGKQSSSEQSSSEQSNSEQSNVNMPGVRQVLKNGPYSVVEVIEVESLMDLGIGTKWCTRRDYPDCQAKAYLNQYDNIYIIFKDGKPFIQFTPDYDQVMDIKDDEVDVETKFKIINMMEPVTGINVAHNPKLAYEYARDVIKGRWPKGEPTIVQNIRWAYDYAKDVINGRWSEAEPAIAQNAGYAYSYAKDVIKGRFPEAEPTIAKDYEYACYYARDVINGRFPEAESIMAKNAGFAFKYAREAIKGRFPDGESAIAKNAGWSYNYARDVIKGRFPEGESAIAQNASFAFKYAKDIIKGRFHEGESEIAKNELWADIYARDIV